MCGAAGDYKPQFCPAYYRSLPFNHHTCPICALPLPPSVSPDMLCGHCIKKVIIQLKNWKKCLTRFFCIFFDFKEDCLPASITIHT
ncbi:MAG: hypothetical protein KZQ62_11450, partial [Candidatus Thiodiazotropha sp. (ex Lucinoma aequizonata)]|nr:hypothetical protein [Candidatus Thiodiazotropha sp. (ex Lucinoma aequizonata)]